MKTATILTILFLSTTILFNFVIGNPSTDYEQRLEQHQNGQQQENSVNKDQEWNGRNPGDDGHHGREQESGNHVDETGHGDQKAEDLVIENQAQIEREEHFDSNNTNRVSRNNLRKIKIFVKDGNIINKSTGSGSSSISRVNNHVRIMIDGKSFESDDVIGPYIITMDENGEHLIRKEMTDEDRKEMEQVIMEQNQWQQNFQQAMDQWRQQFQENMNTMMSDMFGPNNSMFPGGNIFARNPILTGNPMFGRNGMNHPLMNMFGR